MMLFSWLFPEPTPEKEKLVHRIEEETERLNCAVADLHREVRAIKKRRSEMAILFDEALEAMRKEYRK